jgi:hypothetical protein
VEVPTPTAKVAKPTKVAKSAKAVEVPTPKVEVPTPTAKVAKPTKVAKSAKAVEVPTPKVEVPTPTAKVAKPTKVAKSAKAVEVPTPKVEVPTPTAKVAKARKATKVETPTAKVEAPSAKVEVPTPTAKVAKPTKVAKSAKAVEVPTPKVEVPTPTAKVAKAKKSAKVEAPTEVKKVTLDEKIRNVAIGKNKAVTAEMRTICQELVNLADSFNDRNNRGQLMKKGQSFTATKKGIAKPFPMSFLVYIAVSRDAHKESVFNSGYKSIDVKKAKVVMNMCKFFGLYNGKTMWSRNDKVVHACCKFYDKISPKYKDFEDMLKKTAVITSIPSTMKELFNSWGIENN